MAIAEALKDFGNWPRASISVFPRCSLASTPVCENARERSAKLRGESGSPAREGEMSINPVFRMATAIFATVGTSVIKRQARKTLPSCDSYTADGISLEAGDRRRLERGD